MKHRLDGRGIGLGVAIGALLAVTGTIAEAPGLITCTEEDYSATTAPHLCAMLGSGRGLVVALLIAPMVVLALALAPVPRRLLAYAAAGLLVAQALFLTMWALVAHGTIAY